MSDFTVGVKLTADSKELVGEVKGAQESFASWHDFLKSRMGPAMAEFKGQADAHAQAIRKIAEEWKQYKAGAEPAISVAQQLNAEQKNLASTLGSQSSLLEKQRAASESLAAAYQKMASAQEAEKQAAAASLAPFDAARHETERMAESARNYADDLRKLARDNKGFADTIGEIRAPAAAAAEGMTVAAAGATGLGLNTQYARRELMLLGKEALTGDFSHMPRTFGSLVAHSNLLQAAMSPIGLAILAVSAAAATLAYAFVAGGREMKEMNHALDSTNNYAGMTRGSMIALAESIEKSGNLTIGTSKDIVTQIVASGRYASENVSALARLVENYAHVSGDSAEKATPKLIKMFEDPSKALVELTQRYHFLQPAELERVRALEQAGDKQGAVNLAINTFNASMTEYSKQLSYAGQMWVNFLKMLSDAKEGIKGIALEMSKQQLVLAKQAEINRLLDVGVSADDERVKMRERELVVLVNAWDVEKRIAAEHAAGTKVLAQQLAANEIAKKYGADRLAAIQIERQQIIANATEAVTAGRALMALDKEAADIRKAAGADARKLAEELKKLRAEDLKGIVAAAGAVQEENERQTKALAEMQIKAADERKKQEDAARAAYVKNEVEAAGVVQEENERQTLKYAEFRIAANKKITDAALAEQKSINHSLTDALLRGFEAGKGFARNFLDTLVNMFKTTYLTPVVRYILSPVSGAIASGLSSMGLSGAASAASGASDGGGIMNLLSGANSLGSIFGGPSLTSAFAKFGSSFATYSTMVGEGATAMSALSASTAGLGASFATLIPYVGLAVAAYMMFAGGHETVQGSGSSTIAPGGSITSAAGQLHGGYDPTGVINTAAAAILSFSAIVTGLGGTITDAFGIGIGQGGGGEYNVVADVGGRQLADHAGLDATQAQLEAQRAILTGLQQAADFPDYIDKVFAAINAGTASSQQIQDAIAFATTLQTIHQNLTETRPAFQILTDAAAALEATLNTSAATFKTDFLAAIDAGITPAALAQWQQLAGYIDAVNASLAKLEQDRASILESFMTPAQKYAAAQNQINEALDAIGYAGPRTVDAYLEALDGLNLNTDAGRALYAILGPLSGAFHTVADAAEVARLAAEAEAEALVQQAQASQQSFVQAFSAPMTATQGQSNINAAAASYGIDPSVLPQTTQGWADLMASLDATDPAMHGMIQALMDLQPSIQAVTDAYLLQIQAATDAQQAFINQFGAPITASQGQSNINAAAASAGIDPSQLPQTTQQWADLMATFDPLTEEGQHWIDVLTELAPSIAAVTDATEADNAASEAAAAMHLATMNSLANEQQQLEIDLMRAQGDEAGALAAQREIDISSMNAAEIAMYDHNQSLRDEIEAANEAAAAAAQSAATTQSLMEEQASLEIQLMEAQGDAAGALAAQRAIDIEGMTEAQIAIYDHNQALRDEIDAANEAAAAVTAAAEHMQDAAEVWGSSAYWDRIYQEQQRAYEKALRDAEDAARKVADERKGLQDQLDELTMTSVQLLEKQRNALDESNRALFDQVQAARAAAEASRAAAEAARAAAEAQRQLNQWLQANALDSNLSPLTAQQRFAESQSQYVETLLAAQGGDQDAISQITGYADAYLQEALQMYGRASTDYVAIYRAIRGQVGDLSDAQSTITVQQVLQAGQQTAQQQAADLIAEVRALRAELAALTTSVSNGNDNQVAAIVEVVGAVEQNATDTVRGIANLPNKTGRLS